ncbi:MAG: 50S ribosomal protein L24 [Chloroflexi bacterium]|nr:MAG: 50S ribosomal protein L24 [Chloroflexota bacterium]RLC92384.1 MAG: 50S ribosomal protein L24 [Chloroflexota bacterium]HEY67886.1 50S ribosomal protein L24 [Thermoflexia bacterium]
MGNRIKQGDTVEVISGEDRGIRGTVQRVLPKKNRVVVSGVNIVKKHQRPIRAGRGQVQPGIIEFEAPIHLSNVMLVCPRCNQRTRVGFAWQEDGRKVRVCKRCGEAID